MRLFMPLLLGAVFTAASVASARDAGTDTSLCDTIAAAHVDPPTLQDYVFKYPLEQLSKGERPFIESAGYMGRPATEPIERNFHPEPELAKVFARYGGSSADFMNVLGFPGSTVHAVMSEGGSDACQTWVLFDAPKNGNAHMLPALPKWIDGGLEDSCEPHWGTLVRVKGQVAFLKRDEDIRKDWREGVTLRVAPLIGGQWGKGCRIKYLYPTSYNLRKISVAKDGTVPREALERALPKLIEAKLLADKAEELFRFSDDATPATDLIRHPVVQGFHASSDRKDFDLPQFDAPDADAGLYKLPWSEGTKKLGSVRLQGRSYVTRSGMPEPNKSNLRSDGPLRMPYLIIFYDVDPEKAGFLDDLKDKPVASAVVEYGPGSPMVTVSGE